jgi:FecR protein
MRSLRIIATAGLLLTPCALAAQEPVDSDPPAHVSFVDGTAVIERDGQRDTAPTNMPLLAGDRIRTESGRVEILFADGSTLHIDNFTTVDFQSDELVRLLDGRLRLTVAGRPRDVGYRIDGPGAWAQISQPGEYRLAVTRGDRGVEVELAVLRGAAELVNDDGRTPLRAGERAFARVGAAPSHAYVFNSASWDAFDRWSETRRDDRLGLSTQYLPEPVRPYTRAFDRYGTWRHEPQYGYVWYPTVAVSWRPYYHGRWTTLRPWGWVWVGNDPWAWPTHHYGRWGFSAGAWFWIPGRTWGPAWVSWAYTPGYVSWCPLGWNNRPLFSIVNVNVYRGYDPWRGWTVVRRDHFGRDYVHRRVVNWHTLDARSRGAWESRQTAPEFRGYAVPRSQAPLRVVGRAVPRGTGGSAPVYTNRSRDASRVQSSGARIQVDDARPSPGVDRDPRGRAVPRAGNAEAPRMVPDRGVRSAPAIRSGAGVDVSERPRAVQRDPAARTEGTPAIRSRGGNTSPSLRRAPAPQPTDNRPGETEVRPDRGVRAVPRGSSSGGGGGGAVRAPERRAPDMPSSGGVRPRDDVYRGNPRMPSERSAPDRPSYGEPRAMPRAMPRTPEARPAPSMPPPPRPERSQPQIERRAPPSRSVDAPPPARSAPPSRTRPGGGGGGSGSSSGRARRRDG